ncbi:MAG: hypothetical protein N4A32_02405 [Marinifilaceae bacterium]|jgi:hypothetical protein|nr:hypothetical protein [Marinifilaceae bacterium]
MEGELTIKSKDRESIHRSLRKLNPLNQNVERLIKFTRNGELVSNDADEDVEYDIETLNLNEYFLKKSRCDIIDELQERYSIEARRGRKREFLKQEMKRWSSCNRDGNLPEYNLVALKFIDKKTKYIISIWILLRTTK